jgi:MFS family permease
MVNPFASKIFRALSLLYSTTLISGLGWAMILPAIPVLSTEFDISLGASAQVVTTFGIGRLVGTPIGGILADRFGSRLTLCLGPSLSGMAALMAFLTPWFSVILITMFFIGIADAMWTIGREIAGIDLVRVAQRGRVLSGFFGVYTTGQTIGPLIGGVLTVAFTFHAIFLALIGMSVAAFILGLNAHNSRPLAPVKVVNDPSGRWLKLFSPRQHLSNLKDLLGQIDRSLRPTYVVLIFATFTNTVFRIGLQSMLPLYAGGKLGLSPAQVGALFSISGALVFVMIVPSGFIIDKIGRKWASVPSTGFPAVAFALIPFADTFNELLPLVSLTGVAIGLSLGSLATSTYDIAPPASRGRVQATRRTIANLGGIGAPLIGGALANAFDPGVSFLAFAPLLLAGAVLLAWFGKETLIKDPGRTHS